MSHNNFETVVWSLTILLLIYIGIGGVISFFSVFAFKEITEEIEATTGEEVEKTPPLGVLLSLIAIILFWGLLLFKANFRDNLLWFGQEIVWPPVKKVGRFIGRHITGIIFLAMIVVTLKAEVSKRIIEAKTQTAHLKSELATRELISTLLDHTQELKEQNELLKQVVAAPADTTSI